MNKDNIIYNLIAGDAAEQAMLIRKRANKLTESYVEMGIMDDYRIQQYLRVLGTMEASFIAICEKDKTLETNR